MVDTEWVKIGLSGWILWLLSIILAVPLAILYYFKDKIIEEWQKTPSKFARSLLKRCSGQHACKTLANYCDLVAPRFRLGELTDYEKHLKDFVDGYNYDI